MRARINEKQTHGLAMGSKVQKLPDVIKDLKNMSRTFLRNDITIIVGINDRDAKELYIQFNSEGVEKSYVVQNDSHVVDEIQHALPKKVDYQISSEVNT